MRRLLPRVLQVLTCTACTLGVLTCASAFAQGRGAAPAAPSPSPRAAAPFDLAGTWVAVVTEDWRYRMVTPTKGDYQGIPMNVDAARIADRWNPDADERAGLQCKSYAAPVFMRLPGRLRITWQADDVLKVEMDTGSQTRLWRFGAFARSPQRSWQGDSTASWELPARRGGGAAPPPARGGAPPTGRGAPPQPAAATPRPGALKVVTTNLREGYLRKNGVPFSESATVTEYIDRAQLRDGAVLLVVTSIVEDPKYLTQPYITSTQFKLERDDSRFEPSPCSSTW